MRGNAFAGSVSEAVRHAHWRHRSGTHRRDGGEAVRGSRPRGRRRELSRAKLPRRAGRIPRAESPGPVAGGGRQVRGGRAPGHPLEEEGGAPRGRAVCGEGRHRRDEPLQRDRRDHRPRERRVLERATTPERVQRWLESLPYNHEERGETLRTFRGVVRTGKAHCLEAALSAATILEQHGYPPTVLDLESKDDIDHVVFLFREGGKFGSVARSRDPGLHGRKPAFRSVRGLVFSYVDPYVDRTGRINGYGVLDLRTLRADWRLSPRNVWAVEQALIRFPHRRFRSSDERYRRWHEKYLRYKERFPNRRPVFYPNRHRWL